jgi:hypothetical protein
MCAPGARPVAAMAPETTTDAANRENRLSPFLPFGACSRSPLASEREGQRSRVRILSIS